MSSQPMPVFEGRITHYEVEFAPSLEKLVEKVNARLQQGWQPQGGVSFEYPNHGFNANYAQALVWRAGKNP